MALDSIFVPSTNQVPAVTSPQESSKRPAVLQVFAGFFEELGTGILQWLSDLYFASGKQPHEVDIHAQALLDLSAGIDALVRVGV